MDYLVDDILRKAQNLVESEYGSARAIPIENLRYVLGRNPEISRWLQRQMASKLANRPIDEDLTVTTSEVR